jgi:hypothetical protein
MSVMVVLLAKPAVQSRCSTLMNRIGHTNSNYRRIVSLASIEAACSMQRSQSLEKDCERRSRLGDEVLGSANSEL